MPTMLLGPTQRLTGRPRTVEEYRAVVAAQMASDGRVSAVDRRRALQPYVNEGRWVADCPQCASGILIDPEWPEAGCLECGTWFLTVAVRLDWRAVEQALVARPVQNRNASVDETAEALQKETEAHAQDVLTRASRRGR